MAIERAKAIITIVITAIVNIANVCGYAMDADTWINAALSVLSAVTIIISWWRNNNITEPAIEAQKVLITLKAEEKATKKAA